jgi:hypothetical protein
MAVTISVYRHNAPNNGHTQRYGGDGWQFAFLYIDTIHVTMDTVRCGVKDGN